MVRKIVLYGDPVLRTQCKEISKSEIDSPEIQILVDDMVETMQAGHGVGLAAPQVGESIRLIVFDAGEGLNVVFNPRIVRESGEETDVEGCLSIPGLQGDVSRALRVTMRGSDRQGQEIRIKGEELLARVMQHELDHLNGVLFMDRAISETLHWVSVQQPEAEGIQRV